MRKCWESSGIFRKQLAGFTQLLEVVATSTCQLEGFTGGLSQAQEVWQAGGAGELVEACPALRKRWRRLKPDFQIASVKSGVNTVRLTLRFTGICSDLNLG